MEKQNLDHGFVTWDLWTPKGSVKVIRGLIGFADIATMMIKDLISNIYYNVSSWGVRNLY